MLLYRKVKRFYQNCLKAAFGFTLGAKPFILDTQNTGIASRFVKAVLFICADKSLSVKDFCEDMPFSASYINQLKQKPGVSVGANFIVALYQKHKVNPMWVLLEQGNMFETPENIDLAKDIAAIKKEVAKTREVQSTVIEKLLDAILRWEVTPQDIKAKLINEAAKRNKTN